MSERLGSRLSRIAGLPNRSLVIGVVAALTSLTATTSERVKDIFDLFSTGSAAAQPAPRGVEVPPAHSTPAEDPEERRIAEMEEAFESFAQKVLAGLDRHVSSEKMREDIRKIVGLFRSNRASGRHNFDYEFDSDEKYSVTSFDHSSRTIFFSDEFDPNDLVAISGLAHEIKHADQDSDLRKRVASGSLPEERYSAFTSVNDGSGNGDTIVAIPAHETEAVALQLEMLNAAIEGRLRADVLAGRAPKMPTQVPDSAIVMAWYAKEYFGDPDGFGDFMRDLYSRIDGVVRFTPDLVKIN